MGDAQKTKRMERQRVLDVKDDDGVTALMNLGRHMVGREGGEETSPPDRWSVWLGKLTGREGFGDFVHSLLPFLLFLPSPSPSSCWSDGGVQRDGRQVYQSLSLHKCVHFLCHSFEEVSPWT